MEALSPFGGMEVDFMERRSHLLLLGGCGVDFRSPEVGISALYVKRR